MKKLLPVALALLLILPGMSGCGRGGKTAQPTPTGTYAPGQRMQVTIGLWGMTAAAASGPSAKMNALIGEKYGIELVPWAMTSTDWKQKIAEASASNSLPDVFAQGIFEDRMLFKQLIDQQQIRELPENIYKNYVNLGSVLYRYKKTDSVDGKMYFVPRTDMFREFNNGQTTGIYYRLDWAMKGGLVKAGEAPDWKKFMSMLDYYTNNDPDGDKFENTLGLTAAGPGLGGLEQAFLMPMGVRDWVLEGGQWVPGVLSNRAKEGVKWAVQAYRTGLLDSAFSTQTEQQAMDKFVSGKVGMLVMDASPEGAARLDAAWTAKHPDGDFRQAVSLLAQPLNPYGISYNEDNSYHTGTVFSAAVNDEKLKRVFSLMDWLFTENGLTFARYGSLNADYKVVDGQPQTLLKGTDGKPATFAELNREWAAVGQLSTWATDFAPGVKEDDYRLKFMGTLQQFWWPNNWRRPMFTDYIFDPGVAGFDADGKAEAALAQMILTSSNVENDWGPYVEQMKKDLNVDAVAKVVNDYAKAHKITKEE